MSPTRCVSRGRGASSVWAAGRTSGPGWPLRLLDTLTLLPLLSLCPEKKCYRESFIDDSPELDLPPPSAGSKDSGGHRGSCWCPSPRCSLHSAGSLGSSRVSGVESKEMSVDGPLGTEEPCGEVLSCSASASHSSGDADDSSRGRPERDTRDEKQGDGEHVAGEPPAWSSLCVPERGCAGLTSLSRDGGPRPGGSRRTGSSLWGVGVAALPSSAVASGGPRASFGSSPRKALGSSPPKAFESSPLLLLLSCWVQ